MGKAVHSAKSSYGKTELQNLILESLAENSEFLSGELKFTEAGGYEDKKQKIDAYIGDDSIQVKMDYQSTVKHTTAIEIAQLNLVTSDYNKGDYMSEPIAGGVTEKQLMDVNYIYYILPGQGISIWKPTNLSRLVFHCMRSIPLDVSPQEIAFDGIPLKGENGFKIAVAANKESEKNMWSSLCYLLPNEYLTYKLGIPLGHWERDWQSGDLKFYANEDDKKYRIVIKPVEVIEWDEVLNVLIQDRERYEEICGLVKEYIYKYKYGKRKAFMIADSFNINSEYLKLHDWSQ